MNDLKIVFLDLETSGLDENAGNILELGAVGVDAQLNELFRVSTPIALPPYLAISDLVEMMPEQVVLMHTENGLISDLHHNSAKLTHPLINTRDEDSGEYLLPDVAEADQALSELIDQYSEDKVFLAGSGVSHFDRRWLAKHMPYTECRFDRSTFDVGIMRRIYEFFIGQSLTDANDRKTHRAIDDVDCHIEEFREFVALFIRDHIAREQILRIAENFGVVPEPAVAN